MRVQRPVLCAKGAGPHADGRRNEDAERDCDAVLRLDGKNVKGLFRRGQARLVLLKLKEAEAGVCRAICARARVP